MSQIVATHPLNIFWSLLPSPDPVWQFSSVCSSQSVLMLNNHILINLAQKIVGHPSKKIILTFTGFQPALHPHFDDIVSWLADSGKDIDIVVETDRRVPLSAYKRLISKAAKASISFNLYINPDNETKIGVLTSIQTLAENCIPFKIFLVGCKNSHKTDIYKSICTLRRTINFELADTAVALEDREFCNRSQCANVTNEGKDFLCLTGQNFLRIDVSGAIYTAPCNCSPSLVTSWKEKTLWLNQFKNCSCSECMANIAWGLPRFYEPNEARKYLLQTQDLELAEHCKKQNVTTEEESIDSKIGTSGSMVEYLRKIHGEHKDSEKTGQLEIQRRTSFWHDEILATLKNVHLDKRPEWMFELAGLLRLAKSGDMGEMLLTDCVKLFDARRGQADYTHFDVGEHNYVGNGKTYLFSHAKASISAQPFFSIILYNHNSYPALKRTLGSILTQDFTNFEILAFDAASTDMSFGLLKDYLGKDTRIRLYSSNKTINEGRARNVLLNYASGKYIAYMHAGATYAPSFLRSAYCAIISSHPDVAMLDTKTKKSSLSTNHRVLKLDGLGRTAAIEAYLKGEFECGMIGKIFNREHLQTTCPNFSKYDICSDDDFMLSTLLNAQKIIVRNFEGNHEADVTMPEAYTRGYLKIKFRYIMMQAS